MSNFTTSVLETEQSFTPHEASTHPSTCSSDYCPRCGAPVGIVSLYVGGRGYLPYAVCQSQECDFQKREAN